MIPIRIAILALPLLAVTPAMAAGPDYVGTWAVAKAQCKNGQENQSAPMILRADGYDQHETHCTFTSRKPAGSSWKIVAACTVEGNAQRDTLLLTPNGQSLVVTRGHVSRKMVRCR